MENLQLTAAKRNTTINVFEIEEALRAVAQQTNVDPRIIYTFYDILKSINERQNGKRMYYKSTPIDYKMKYLAVDSLACNVPADFWVDVIDDINYSIFGKQKYKFDDSYIKHKQKAVILCQYIEDDDIYYVIRDGDDELEYSNLSAVETVVKNNNWQVVWGSDYPKPKCSIAFFDDEDEVEEATTITSLNLPPSITSLNLPPY